MPASRSFAFSSLCSLLAVSSLAHAEPASAEAAPPATPAQETAPSPDPEPAAAAPVEPAPVAPAAAEPAPPAAPDAAPETPKPKPPPYSLPFQLRPVSAGTVIRSDTAFAFYDAAGKSGSTVATTLLGSYKITPEFAPLVRVGLVENSPPAGPSGTGFLNPVIGAIYGIKPSPETRLGLFLGVTLPIGSGGGNSPDLGTATAIKSGPLARSAMDNAMFAVNYFAVFPGVGFAYVANGLTVQAETTLFQLARVRGDKVEKDSSKTNLTMGLHVGYFLIPELSLGAEIRHQRWLSTPASVKATPATRDTTTFAVGPRVHIKLSDSVWFRPGIAYARGLDEPMTKGKYNIVQLDLPFSF